MNPVEITALNVYPVKSLGGIELDQAVLTARGLLHDRRFMIVKTGGQFVTQRTLPELALIRTRLESSALLLLREGFGQIDVSLQMHGGEPVSTSVWKDSCETLDCGDEAAEWLTEASGGRQPLRLVRMKPGFSRRQNRPQRFGAEHTTYFADAAPFLVANEASLDTLNSELLSRNLQSVPMNRFRPNIVVRGMRAFGEHHFGSLKRERIALRLCDPCERCVVTTIDQATARKDPDWQPFNTLKDLNPMPGNARAPAFGQNAVLSEGAGERLSVGDFFTPYR